MHKLGVKQNHMSWPNMYYGVGLLGESGLKKKDSLILFIDNWHFLTSVLEI